MKHLVTILDNIHHSKSLVLQIDEIINVGAPISQQAPIESNEEESPTPNFFVNRTLKLFLTDGITNIIAIERVPLPGLTPKTPAGCKLWVSGKTLVRHGALMLDPTCARVLGGECEGLDEGGLGGNTALQQEGVTQQIPNSSLSLASSSTSSPPPGVIPPSRISPLAPSSSPSLSPSLPLVDIVDLMNDEEEEEKEEGKERNQVDGQGGREGDYLDRIFDENDYFDDYLPSPSLPPSPCPSPSRSPCPSPPLDPVHITDSEGIKGEGEGWGDMQINKSKDSTNSMLQKGGAGVDVGGGGFGSGGTRGFGGKESSSLTERDWEASRDWGKKDTKVSIPSFHQENDEDRDEVEILSTPASSAPPLYSSLQSLVETFQNLHQSFPSSSSVSDVCDSNGREREEGVCVRGRVRGEAISLRRFKIITTHKSQDHAIPSSVTSFLTPPLSITGSSPPSPTSELHTYTFDILLQICDSIPSSTSPTSSPLMAHLDSGIAENFLGITAIEYQNTINSLLTNSISQLSQNSQSTPSNSVKNISKTEKEKLKESKSKLKDFKSSYQWKFSSFRGIFEIEMRSLKDTLENDNDPDSRYEIWIIGFEHLNLIFEET